MVDKLSKKLASGIARSLSLDSEREEIIAYGALNLIHTSFSGLLIVFFGIITKSLVEILLISLTAAMLRQFSGGAHATSSNRCAVTSVILFGSLSQAAKYLISVISVTQALFFQLVVLIFTLLVLYKFAPIDNPNKRITNKKMRIRLRRLSFVTVLIVELLSLFCWMFFLKEPADFLKGFVINLHMGLLWQSLSITFVGHYFVKSVDALLMKVKI